MSQSVDKELEGLQKELLPMVNKLQSQLVQQLEQMERGCIEQSSNNVERFVECMLKRTKKIEKEEKRFQFKLAYMQNVTQACFQQAMDKQASTELCKANAKDSLDRYLKDLFQSINQ